MKEGKTIAIISYITLIGFIIALIMNTDKKNSFASYHLRQSLGIYALYFMVSVFLFILSSLMNFPFLSTILYAGLFVLWILGILAAIQGETKPVPIFGDKFQDWFKNIG
jgi:uncharacterized membrane protein